MNPVPENPRRPLLFEIYPGLVGRLPFTPLVAAPTPVQLLERASRRLGREIWVKRDDLTSPVYGGNKPRKLEFLLGQALAQGKKFLVTTGGLGTNHGLASAIFGRQLGFQVLVLLYPQPVTAQVRQNLLLLSAHGALTQIHGSLAATMLDYYLWQKARKRGAFFIPPGGSNPLGTIGFVEAGLELARQVQRNELPRPAAIFTAAGTCGTQAGLILGLKLAGLEIPVIGVRTATGLAANPHQVVRLAGNTIRLLRKTHPSLPAVKLTRRDAPINQAQFGRGYGHPTPTGRAALALLADTEGLQLDLTYTAKTFAGLIEHIGAELDQGPLLFWHTYNSVDLSQTAAAQDPRSLPPALRRYFEAEVN
jgi:D-cysteine desulfhydrase